MSTWIPQLCTDGEFLSKYRGTLDYMAPELLGPIKRYNAKADIWSVGVLLYALLSGALPFRRAWPGLSAKEADVRTRDFILAGRVELEAGPWARVSPPAKALVRRMLTVDPDARPGAMECLRDAWIADAAGPGGPGGDLGLHVLAELRRLNESRASDGYSGHAMAGPFRPRPPMSWQPLLA
jgi:serine/threonine protein kinase